jgi:hypothetical protein
MEYDPKPWEKHRQSEPDTNKSAAMEDIARGFMEAR